MESLTYPQIVTAAVALVAVIISLVSLRRTSKVQEQQLRLQRKQEELTDLQLESLRRQSQTRTLPAAAVAASQERADVRVDLERVGRDYKFIITNWGRVPSRDVTFGLDLGAGKPSPLLRGDYDVKIPIPELGPGNRVPLLAAITLGMAPIFPARWSWRNPDGSVETRKSQLAI
jgi:hypothetical protein